MVDRLIAELAEQPAEPVAQVVSSGHWELPCLQWMSADHSFRAPIGTKLFAHPDPRIAALETLLQDILSETGSEYKPQRAYSLLRMPKTENAP